MKYCIRLLLGVTTMFWLATEAAFAEHLSNLKKLYTAEKAYSVPGHDLQLGSYFDVTFDGLPAGGSMTGTFDVSTEISLDGGGFVPLAGSGLHIHHDTAFDYLAGEFLSMSLTSSVGSPPLLMRESPTLQSQGKTKPYTVGGHAEIESFFDVFAELSLDGGNTWLAITPSIPIGTVPEPATALLLLMGTALGEFAVGRTRRRKRRITSG